MVANLKKATVYIKLRGNHTFLEKFKNNHENTIDNHVTVWYYMLKERGEVQ
jgi:hypothetical protein